MPVPEGTRGWDVRFLARCTEPLELKTMQRRESKRAKKGKASLDASKLEYVWAFHACAAEAVDNILGGGFNRSYAGKNATVYGRGSYFARDTTYSARNTYSPPDQNGLKRIFMCRLALGAHMQVQAGYDLPEPPVRDAEPIAGVGTLKYDSTTNGKHDAQGIPEVMVAFRDNQAYAEYLITFKM